MECACFVAVLIMWGLVYSHHKRALQEGAHSVGAHSASLNKENIQNTEVRGLVDTRRKRACQEGTHGLGEDVDAPHTSASLNKGNIQNTEVSEGSVAVACVVPDAGDTAFQIHCLRRSAYAAVLRAFCTQSDLFSRVCFVGTSSYSYKFKCKRLADKSFTIRLSILCNFLLHKICSAS